MTDEVRVINGKVDQTSGSCDFVRVCTSHDPHDDTVTLATIQRVVARPVAREEPTWRIKTLIQKQPMSWDAAVGLATCYAKRKNISVVYAEGRCPQSDAP